MAGNFSSGFRFFGRYKSPAIRVPSLKMTTGRFSTSSETAFVAVRSSVVVRSANPR
jgi:hypothetical protein